MSILTIPDDVWKKWKTRVAVKAVKPYWNTVLTGKMLALDPSCGSASSMPGYAVFEAGELIESGTIELDLSMELPGRLQKLARCLSKDFGEFDILALENISPTRGTRFGARATHGHSSLLKSVGVCMASAQWTEGAILLRPQSWQAVTRLEGSAWIKGDAEDAEWIGWSALTIANKLKETGK